MSCRVNLFFAHIANINIYTTKADPEEAATVALIEDPPI
jgi:hypothetical protein